MTHLKYFSVSYLITIHSITWIAYTAGVNFAYEKNFLLRAGVIGALCNLFIPATAGAALRFRLAPYIKGDRAVNFPIEIAFNICIFLFAIESLKSFFVYGFEYFFSWNALHFNGLAIFIVAVLATKSIRSLAIVAVLAVVLEPFLRPLLGPYQIMTWEQAAALADTNYLSIMLRCYILLFAALALFLILRKQIVPWSQRVFASVVVLFVAMGLYFYFLNYQTESSTFAARLYNLMLGALIGDQFGFHYWPLVPWISVFIFGFLTYHYLLKEGEKFLKFFSWMCLPAVGYLTYFWNFELDSILDRLGLETLWSQYIFISGWGMILATISMFVLNVTLCNLAEKRRWFTHHLIFEPVSDVFNRMILLIYLFMTTLAIPMAKLFNFLFPVKVNFVLFPIAMHIMSFILGYIFIRITDSKVYRISLVKNR